jgi:hypothetical protein
MEIKEWILKDVQEFGCYLAFLEPDDEIYHLQLGWRACRDTTDDEWQYETGYE